MRDIGPLEIALIVGAVVLIFGVGKLGDIGGALGKSIHDFRKERDRKDDPQADATASKTAMAVIGSGSTSATGRVCQDCGKQMSDKAKFCMGCGSRL
jgi:sec-independent protein translocase protein TatA